ncbi:sugar ABC transporter ATP-binding protein [Consotaella aegiceratis]|uniref:sugar ABC transporter ATP-binding protein n=1 Tax=Consotaella aegiceratis TaxID=3097961 RepID=UPI002F417D0A
MNQPPRPSEQPLVQVTGLSKSFGQNSVLKNVSFRLERGEVLALVGENGAGKSTMMNILSGGLSYDDGTITLAGRSYRPASPQEAIRSGIALAHQETAVMPDLTVAENIYFRREPKNRFGLIRQKQLHADCATLFKDLGFDIDPSRFGYDLTAAERQIVEISRAILREPQILILDEPTASLSAQAARHVMDLMARLSQGGTSVIFISHRLDEVMTAADRVVVLKDGELTLEARRGDFDRDSLIQAMVGRTLTNVFPERPAIEPDRKVVFALEDAANAEMPPINLAVRSGEVLGIAGLEGQGQKPLAAALCGDRPFTRGRVALDGAPLALSSVASAIKAGIASIPDDRKHDGLALGLPIHMNMSLFAITAETRSGLLPLGREMAFCEDALSRFSIRSSDVHQPVGELSGGNQQKVVFARWLAHVPKLLVLFEPTKGVDIQSKSEIYRLVGELTDQGVAVVLISSDLLELIGLSDRILTLFERRITAEVPRADFSEETIMRHAAGSRTRTEEAADA